MSRPGSKILVAEDEALIRELIVELLAGQGHTVMAVGSGEEAVGLLDDWNDIALLITDINMRHMSGIELARFACRKSPTIGVIFVSGRLDLLAASSSALPPHRLLGKPFRLKDLLDLVRLMLRRAP